MTKVYILSMYGVMHGKWGDGIIFFKTSLKENNFDIGSSYGGCWRDYEEESEIVCLLFTLRRYKTQLNAIISKSVENFPFQTDKTCRFGGIILDSKIFVGFGRGLYEYKFSENKWDQLQCPGHLQQHSRSRAEGCCLMDDVYLLCGGDLKTRVELLAFRQNIPESNTYEIEAENKVLTLGDEKDATTSNHLNPLSCNTTHENNKCLPNWLQCKCLGKFYVDRDAEYETTSTKLHRLTENGGNQQEPKAQKCSKCIVSQTFCPTYLPLELTGGHTITRIGKRKVILIGGYCNGSITNQVFIGELTENKTDVIWTKAEPLRIACEYHITFKMKENVFVAGGVNKDYEPLYTCERFSLNKNRWSIITSKYQLPHPLVNATALVSNDETFSIIIGGWKSFERLAKTRQRVLSDEIIVFTTEYGFTKLEKTDLRYKSIRGRDVIFKVY